MRKPLSLRIRFEILKRDGFSCVYCGAHGRGVELHVDHVKPVALGGDNDPRNLATACAQCNFGKRHHPLNDNRNIKYEQMEKEGRQRRTQWIHMLGVTEEVHEMMDVLSNMADAADCISNVEVSAETARFLHGLQCVGFADADPGMMTDRVFQEEEGRLIATCILNSWWPDRQANNMNEHGGLLLSRKATEDFPSVSRIYG